MFRGLSTGRLRVARTVARIMQARLTAQDEEQLARVLEIRPETFESYLRAMLQYRMETQEGYQAGIEILEEALANDPTSALAYAALGQGYMELVHSILPRMEALKRALNLNPSLADAWYHRAWWLELKGDDEEAIAAGEKTVELSPLSDFYVAWLGDQYRDAGDHAKAIELAESVVALGFPSYFTATRSLLEDPLIRA